MRTMLMLAAAAALLLVGGSIWSASLQSSDPEVISRNGLHWHPLLEIHVKGQRVDIPADVGVGPTYAGKPGYGDGGMAMTPIHTHEDMPVIHLEFPGLVRSTDITLGKFFEIWGRDMRSFGANMHMTVNGRENTEYENYEMHDGDKIELQYSE